MNGQKPTSAPCSPSLVTITNAGRKLVFRGTAGSSEPRQCDRQTGNECKFCLITVAELSGAAMLKPIEYRQRDVAKLQCRLCGKPMEAIAQRPAGKKVLRTFSCPHCGNIDTIAFNRGEPFKNDAA